jgi:dihydrofolate synthase/folylpolyglutamate synthase
MSYTAAVDHLYARGLELVSGPSTPRRKFNLEHMRILARALGNPQDRFPSVLIAGTNGKGSTAATLASILTAAGYRTGLYTSPHLSRVNERIRIDGQPISDDDFARLYFQVDTAAEQLVTSGQLPQHPSFFETLTALAFLYFAGSEDTQEDSSHHATEVVEGSAVRSPSRNSPLAATTPAPETLPAVRATPIRVAPVDIVILEVGLGGRLDATNIVEPLLSILTDISLDHQDYLGDTIAEITREKAGILRHHGTLITLPQHPEANQAIGEAAAALDLHAINAAQYIPTADKLLHPDTTPTTGKLLHLHGRHSERSEQSLYSTIASPAKTPAQVTASSSPTTGFVKGTASVPEVPLPRNRYTITLAGRQLQVDSPLAGQHQQRNIALAIAAAEELRNPTGYKSKESNFISYKITNAQIERGIRNTQWPGRLELLPLPGSAPILLDVAHNPAGAWTLRAALGQLPDDLPRTLLFSCLRDKDLREMSQILLPLFDASSPDRPNDHVVLAPIDSPRAATLEDLAAAARDLEVPVETTASLQEALARARELTPANGLIVATGSVYLIGELRSLILASS